MEYAQQSFKSTSNYTMTTPLSNITNDISKFFSHQFSYYIMSRNRQYSILSNDMTATSSLVVTRDNSINLSLRNKKSKRKISNIYHLPIDLKSDEHLNVQHNHVQLISGISKDYFDHGDQSFVCTSCHAKLWQNEALKGNKDGNKTSFSMCCAPEDYQNLYRFVHPEGKHFLNNIRMFNSMFSFTSMGGKVDSSVNKGKGPYIFRLSGQNYHCMGSLLPIDGSKPKFSQLYIYDTDNELSNRQHAFSTQKDGCNSTSKQLDIEIIRFLKVMLDSTNELVKCYRMARDCFNASPNIDLKLRLIGRRQHDGRTYNLPIASEVAALIVGDIGNSIDNRDIIVKTKSSSLQRINELHPAYLAPQYPLLFPYGDDGYRVDIPHRVLRCESYETLRNVKNNGNTDISNIGQRVILPSSFTGGAR
uniref:Helitron helicase-like domain-containing protein n=1 Tax=Lactuca sativa TaxID=4236 RepID=A0A9R1VY61_LACSA|nr:hypothetical protein LSAT_V11C400177910 [Lactuca sativa]